MPWQRASSIWFWYCWAVAASLVCVWSSAAIWPWIYAAMLDADIAILQTRFHVRGCHDMRVAGKGADAIGLNHALGDCLGCAGYLNGGNPLHFDFPAFKDGELRA